MATARKNTKKPKRSRNPGGRPRLFREPRRLQVCVEASLERRLLARYPGVSVSAAVRAALEELLADD